MNAPVSQIMVGLKFRGAALPLGRLDAFPGLYDLTFASGPGGEQSTLVMGEGRNPGIEHLTRLGLEAGLSSPRIDEAMEQAKASLSRWRELAKEHGVMQTNIDLIAENIKDHIR